MSRTASQPDDAEAALRQLAGSVPVPDILEHWPAGEGLHPDAVRAQAPPHAIALAAAAVLRARLRRLTVANTRSASAERRITVMAAAARDVLDAYLQLPPPPLFGEEPPT